jgi:hypothetical protein
VELDHVVVAVADLAAAADALARRHGLASVEAAVTQVGEPRTGSSRSARRTSS